MTVTRIKIARLLVTIPAVFLAVVPPLVDLNATHALNPLWPGHARLHSVWLLATTSLIALMALVVLWRNFNVSSVRLGALLVGAPLLGFFVAALTQSAYGGAFTDPNGVPFRLGPLDANLAVFSLWGALIALALFLVRRTED